VGVDKSTGYQGEFTKGGTAFAITKFSVRSNPNKRDTTSSDDGGYTNADRSNLNAEGRIECVYAGAEIVTGAMGITPGITVESVKLYPDGTSGPFWDFPKVLIDEVEEDVDINGDSTWSFSFTNKGPFTPPQ
jgi:hypothetical protein